MNLYIFSSVNWHSFWQQPQAVAEALANKYKVKFVNPVEIRNKSVHHLAQLFDNKVPNKITLLNSGTTASAFNKYYLVKQELWFKKIAKKLKKEDIAIFYNPIGQLLAFKESIGRKNKTVFMYVDDYSELSKNYVRKLAVKRATNYMISRSDKVFCTSRLLCQDVKDLNSSYTYLPNGVNLKKLSHEINKKAKTSKQKIKTKKIIFGYIGIIADWVRIDDFITLAKNFSEELEIHIVGDGPSMENLKRQSLNFKNIILHGSKPHAEAMQLLSQFDVTLYPFRVNKITHKVSPIKIFEYWAFNKPVLATKTYELEQYKDAIFFYKSKNSLIQQTETILKNKDLLVKKGKNGKNIVTSQHDWSSSLKNKLIKEIDDIKNGS